MNYGFDESAASRCPFTPEKVPFTQKILSWILLNVKITMVSMPD
jgi:hypothetical protein